jgi:hypothetical protein
MRFTDEFGDVKHRFVRPDKSYLLGREGEPIARGQVRAQFLSHYRRAVGQIGNKLGTNWDRRCARIAT